MVLGLGPDSKQSLAWPYLRIVNPVPAAAMAKPWPSTACPWFPKVLRVAKYKRPAISISPAVIDVFKPRGLQQH